MGSFAKNTAKPKEPEEGRTAVEDTPLAIRARTPLADAQHAAVRERLGRSLGKFATHIERVSVRFEDENSSIRGGTDITCRIKVVLSSMPSVIVEEQEVDADRAFQRAATVIERSVRRTLEKAGRSAPQPTKASSSDQGAQSLPDSADEDADATDSDVNVSATIGRNYKSHPSNATVAFEESNGPASRKSTRRSANRARPANPLERREIARTHSPAAKHMRGDPQK